MYTTPSEKSTFSLTVLRKFPFLASFLDDQLEELAEAASRLRVKADRVIFRQGDDSARMYLILQGAVKIEHEDTEGGKLLIGELTQYQTFGETAMLSMEPCQVTITTTEDSEFLAIDRELMLDVIRKSGPDEIVETFSVLSEQIREANERVFKQVLSHRTLAAQMEVEKQRALTQMIAGVAHEINTPLGVINTAISIMARELASPKEVTIQRAADIAESLELMRRNVERAHRLVQDFKKISVSQLVDEKELVDIHEVIDDTIELLMVNLKRSQIAVNFTSKLSDEQKNWIGYRGALSQILINLLTNIERHAYPDGIGGVADVSIELKDERHYLLTVGDCGRGISKENQPRIFEPFFTTERSNGGTGLGLAIVRNLVAGTLKGEIELHVEEGKGTEFRLVFPRIIPD